MLVKRLLITPNLELTAMFTFAIMLTLTLQSTSYPRYVITCRELLNFTKEVVSMFQDTFCGKSHFPLTKIDFITLRVLSLRMGPSQDYQEPHLLACASYWGY